MTTRTGRLMDRLMDVVERRRRLILALWGLALVLSLLPFSKETNHLTAGGFEVPGSESNRVERAGKLFPTLKPNALGVLVLPPAGTTLTAADLRGARGRVASATSAVAHISLASPSSTALAPNGSAAVIALNGPEGEDQAKDVATTLRPKLPTRSGPDRLYFVGQPAVWAGYDLVSKQSLTAAEAVGLPLTGLILVAVFGSLAAALLPLALGFLSIAITGAIIYGLGSVLPMSQFVSNIASLIGIAVGVDYSLFILVRYRHELAGGHDPPGALRIALRTSGRAVLFSGLTVALALAGLFLVDSIALRSMGLGAIIVVAIAVLGALTLTPAAIIMLGERLRAPSPRIAALLGRLRASLRRQNAPPFWESWGERVTRRPWLALCTALTVLVVLAIPAFSMRTVTESLPQLPSSSPERIGAEAAIAHFGPSAGGNTYLLLAYPGAVRPSVERQITAIVRADPAVASVSAALRGRDPHQVLFSVVTRQRAESAYTRAFITRLHSRLAPLAVADGVSIALGGTAAHEVQFDAQITSSLWAVVAFVLLACAVVILLLLRSIVLPLKAIVVNILTVGASFGVLVALFQWKWLNGLLGLEAPGYVATLSLPFVLAIMFGLSMDYEVFLLARVQEEYRRHHDTRLAVRRALQTSGPTITSAAVIMIVVFLAFVAVSLSTIKMIGVGLAVAVTLDATVVRLMLVPAAVVLMGRANWWMPERLRHLLEQPTPQVEPAESLTG